MSIAIIIMVIMMILALVCSLADVKNNKNNNNSNDNVNTTEIQAARSQSRDKYIREYTMHSMILPLRTQRQVFKLCVLPVCRVEWQSTMDVQQHACRLVRSLSVIILAALSLYTIKWC